MNLCELKEDAVRIDGINLPQINHTDLYAHIGCISQSFMLFYVRIGENLILDWQLC